MTSNDERTMSKVELRHYRYFSMLCEEKSFTRAAEQLGITPPTLTHQIQMLERELGVCLLNRKNPKKFMLTESGVRFWHSARIVLHQASEAELGALQAARGEIGRLNLGYLPTVATSGLLQDVLAGFRKDRPGIDVNIRMMVSPALMQAVAQNELDACICSPPAKFPSGLSGFEVFR